MKSEKRRIKDVATQAKELIIRLVDQDTATVDAMAITGSAFFMIAKSLGFKKQGFMKMVTEMANRIEK